MSQPEVVSSRNLGEVSREDAGHKDGDFGFTAREILVLQSLVNGISKGQRAKALGIEKAELVPYESRIAEKLGLKRRQDGLREGIIRGVKFGFLDLSHLPREPVEPLSVRERQVLAAMVKGSSTMEVCGQLGIASRSVSAYRTSASNKLGLHTQYEVLAWSAREMMSRGEL